MLSLTILGNFNPLANVNKFSLLTLASGLKLPKIVSDNIYYKMFENSTNLLIGPMLPATLLKPNCYQEMFKGCVSLRKLASTATNWSLPATVLADYCYNNMFANCILLPGDLSFLKLTSDSLAKGCYKYMFNECTQITNIPNISCSSNFAEECFAYMFNNCENLTKITLNIRNLSNIEDFKSAKENYFDNWVYGVKTTRNTKGISFKYNNDEYAYNETYYNTNYYNDSFIPFKWLADPAYLTFETTEECEIYIKCTNSSGEPIELFDPNLQYRIINENDDTYIEFSDYPFGKDIYLPYWEGTHITLKPGQKLNFVSKNNDLDNCKFSIFGKYFTFCTSYSGLKPDITVSGNINSLTYKYFNNISIDDNYIKPYSFSRLFKDNDTIKNVSEDFLKHTSLSNSCYSYMFNGCTSLTTTPVLPATTLADKCYLYMFSGCSNLTTAPELPATTLAYDCYYGMFSDCSNLTTAPELPATTLAYNCYYYMFFGCSNLTTAPELLATTLTTGCYGFMFSGCTNLNYIKVGFTAWSTNVTNNWLQNIAPEGTFECPEELTIQTGISYIPEGWTVKTY